MATKKVLLVGSSSIQRRRILEAAFGDRFDIICRSPDIDEKAIRHADPEIMTKAIARGKMERILAMINEDPQLKDSVDFAVTSDQVALYKGEVREKPDTEEEAFQYLSDYSDSTVSTVSGIVVADVRRSLQAEGTWWTSTAFSTISDEVKRRVIARKYVMSCAGGFVVEDEELASLRSFVQGTQEEVQGMSVSVFAKLLAELEGVVA